jgi:hypothetical protein
MNMGIRSLKDLEAHQGKLNHHEMIGFKHVYDFETKIPRAEMDLIKVKKIPIDYKQHSLLLYLVRIL